MSDSEVAFAAFGIAGQALLLGFFSARRWSPRIAERLGWLVYAFAVLGLPLGLWLALAGESWRLFTGPLLMAVWALDGAFVDIIRPRPWRRPPIDRRVLVPFLALYFTAQMFLWWPLWDIAPAAWLVFLALFVPSTVLNIGGHFGGEAGA